MDRGAWRAIVPVITRVVHDLVTKPPPPQFPKTSFFLLTPSFARAFSSYLKCSCLSHLLKTWGLKLQPPRELSPTHILPNTAGPPLCFWFYESCTEFSSFFFFLHWILIIDFPSSSLTVQFSSVAQSCLTLCDTMDYSMADLPFHQQLKKFTQTHVHWVGDAIQLSHPLLSPSPPAFNHSQNQGFFQWVSSLHQGPKVLQFQLQHQSSQWILRTDLL